MSDDVCDGDLVTLPNGHRRCTDCPVEFDAKGNVL